jgi:hypothetical protein
MFDDGVGENLQTQTQSHAQRAFCGAKRTRRGLAVRKHICRLVQSARVVQKRGKERRAAMQVKSQPHPLAHSARSAHGMRLRFPTRLLARISTDWKKGAPDMQEDKTSCLLLCFKLSRFDCWIRESLSTALHHSGLRRCAKLSDH